MARISGIEAARGLAALAVVICHTFPATFVVGAAGVDVFFVISGFVMVVSSAKLYGTPGAWRTFLTRRILRIVPLYWLVTLLVAWLLRGYFTWDEILRSLLFVPVRTLGSPSPILSPGWTLVLEMYFYAIFAGFLFLRPAQSAISVAICLAMPLMLRPLLIDPRLGLLTVYYFNPIVLEFAAGMFLGLARRQGVTLPTWAGAVLFPLSIWLLWRSPDARGVTWGIAGIAIVATAGLCRLPQSKTVEATARVAGAISYPMYLIQTVLIGSLARHGVPALLIIVLTIVTAAAVHFTIERPFYLLCLRLWHDAGRAPSRLPDAARAAPPPRLTRIRADGASPSA